MATITVSSKPVKQCTVNTQERGKRYQAAGSDGMTWYNVTADDNGDLTCNCPARVECYHIRTVRPICNTDRWDVWATTRNAQAVAAGMVSSERVQQEHQAAQAARRARAEADKSDLNGWL